MNAALILAMAISAAQAGAPQTGASIDPAPSSEAAAEAPEALVQRQLEAYNGWNLDAFVATYSDDVMLWELKVGDSEPLGSGIANLRTEYRRLFEKVKPKAELIRRVVMGPYVVDHERGDFGGEVVEAAAIYLVDGGKIRRVWFADGSMKGDTPAVAAAIVDRLRDHSIRGRTLHAENHLGFRLARDPVDMRPLVLMPPFKAPAARIQVGPFVIDHEVEGMGQKIAVRLVQEGRIARTWIADTP